MNNTENLSPVEDNETLARFIFYARYIRNNKTVRENAFIPYPHQSLSVTRHTGLNETDLWDIGKNIATELILQLYGRADICANIVRRKRLKIEPTATPRNHANIIGWPTEKSEQKMIAIELAESSNFVSLKS